MGDAIFTRRFSVVPLLFTEATGGTVTTVNIGGVNYNQHEFSTATNFNFVVTQLGTDPSIEVIAWGAGGGGGADRGSRGNTLFTGGGGARVTAKLNAQLGTYTVSVGGGGGRADGGCLAAIGGGAAGTSGSGYTGGRGGHPSGVGCSSPGGGGGGGTALLLGSTELVVAGAGGGGGGVETGAVGSGGRGGGGGQAGQTGAQGTGGATGNQATGVGQTPPTPGTDMSGSGAGGGGYRGGGGGIVGTQDGIANPGGGGGSSFVFAGAIESNIANGNFRDPGDLSNPLRGTAGLGGLSHQGTATTSNGTNGEPGKMIIRYVVQ
jgi:hypothetical protein